MQTTNVTPPETGTLVFSSDGEEIGEITGVEAGYFHVKKGMIFRKDLYIPTSAIVGTALGGDGVQLDIPRAELESGAFSEPPAAADAAGPVGVDEHNTMGTTTPFGTTGASAEMAATPKQTPPAGAEDRFGGGDPATTRPRDDTDVSQQPETQAHWTDDPTQRP